MTSKMAGVQPDALDIPFHDSGRPAIQNAPELLADSTATVLAAGVSLGPYRIESELAEGGMGEVFRAVDTRLGRAVAIKTMHEQFTTRFEREARAIASLNHPCCVRSSASHFSGRRLSGEEVSAAYFGRLDLSTGRPAAW